MPSPFPGMDPFIEGQAWTDFHLTMISEARAALIPLVRPHYIVRVEERVYLDEQARDGVGFLQLPWHQRLLVVQDRESLRPVTIIEILSPAVKQPGSERCRFNQANRNEVLQSDLHFVELDQLRGGQPAPVLEGSLAGEYRGLVARAERRPQAEAYVCSLRQPLPTVPIPLATGDPDVMLDLQAVFTIAYDRAGYDYSLDYRRPVVPPLGEADAAWAQEILSPRWVRRRTC
jgi:hypothetical protein